MENNSLLLKLESFIEFLFLKLLPLIVLFLGYLYLVIWAEQTYSLEKLGYPVIPAGLLTLLLLSLVAVLFYRTLKTLWNTSKAQVFALGVLLFFMGIMGTRVVMQLNGFFKIEQESIAVASLEEIYKAEAEFKASNNKYGTLRELVEAKLLPAKYLTVEGTSGYKYSDSDVSFTDFCIHADRIKNGMGNRDFHIRETGEIRFIRGRIKGTVPRGQGKELYAVE